MAEDSNIVGDIVKAAVILTAATYAQKALNRARSGGRGGTSAVVPTPLKQPWPPKWSAFGEAYCANPKFALYELSTAGGEAVDVYLAHEGLMEAWTEIYLNDDKGAAGPGTPATTTAFGLTPDGWVIARTGSGGRYGIDPTAVRILTTLGSSDQTAMTPIVDQFSDGTWTANHRCRGVAVIGLIKRRGKQSGWSTRYSGGEPMATGAGKFQKVWDPRDGTQTRTNVATHKWTRNLALHTLAFLTTAKGGVGMNYERLIEPHLATFVAAANVCDLDIALKAGGTEKRYHGGVGYYHDAPKRETLAKLLTAFDARLLQASDGAWKLYAGEYQPPVIVLTDKDIAREGTKLFRFQRKDQTVNELLLEYTDKTKQWQMVPAPAWRDQAAINANGLVNDTLSCEPVQSPSHMQRLGKRKRLRMQAAIRGTLMVNPYGFKALGCPTVRIEAPLLAEEMGIPELTGCDFEIQSSSAGFGSLRATLEVTSAPDMVDVGGGVMKSPLDIWDAASEESSSAPAAPPVAPVLTTAPTITGVSFAAAGLAYQATVTVAPPANAVALDDLRWELIWRKGSSGFFTSAKVFNDRPAGASITLLSDALGQGTFEFQAQYVMSDGRPSGYSASFSATTGTAADVIDPVTAAAGLWTAKGTVNASSNPNYPAAAFMHTYRITHAGKIGGGSGKDVAVGDFAVCIAATSAAGNEAAVGANWTIVSGKSASGILALIASLTPSADKYLLFTGASTAVMAAVTSPAQTLLAQTSQALMRTAGLGLTAVGDALASAANQAVARTAIGAVIGTDVLPVANPAATGNLTVSDPSTTGFVRIESPTGSTADLRLRHAGNDRFILRSSNNSNVSAHSVANGVDFWKGRGSDAACVFPNQLIMGVNEDVAFERSGLNRVRVTQGLGLAAARGEFETGALFTNNTFQSGGHITVDFDNSYDLGTGSFRWQDIHLVNAPSVTCDATEKEFVDSPLLVPDRPGLMTDLGIAIMDDIPTVAWKWLNALAREAAGGSPARTHYGASAQAVEAAFLKHGVDPGEHGPFLKSALTKRVQRTRMVKVHAKRKRRLADDRVERVDGVPTLKRHWVYVDEYLFHDPEPVFKDGKRVVRVDKKGVEETLMHREPVMVDEPETYIEDQPVLDADGQQKYRLALRPDEMAALEKAYARTLLARFRPPAGTA